jgi:hypothetical protein
MNLLVSIMSSKTSRRLGVRLCCAIFLLAGPSAIGCGASQSTTEESASTAEESSRRVSDERSAREPEREDAESPGTNADTDSDEGEPEPGVQAVARDSVEAAARTGSSESEAAGATEFVSETEEPAGETRSTVTSTEPEGALRVVAWPKPAEAQMFRALEEDEGIFRSADGVPSPWVFIFALRDGNQEVSGIDLQLPAADGEGAPPRQIYVGYSPTTVDVSRGSFRSVMRSAERLGKVELTDSEPGVVHIAFETPVRAAILVLQVSNGSDGTPLLLDMVDARFAGEPADENVSTVAVEAIPEDVGDSEILFVPSDRENLPDGGSPIDAMEDIGESE